MAALLFKGGRTTQPADGAGVCPEQAEAGDGGAAPQSREGTGGAAGRAEEPPARQRSESAAS